MHMASQAEQIWSVATRFRLQRFPPRDVYFCSSMLVCCLSVCVLLSYLVISFSVRVPLLPLRVFGMAP
jgi:hypothetical protein